MNLSEKFNKLVNIDLKSLVNWLNANKILLNVKKNPKKTLIWPYLNLKGKFNKKILKIKLSRETEP